MLHLIEAYKMPLHPHLLIFPMQINRHQASSLILTSVLTVNLCLQYRRPVSLRYSKYEKYSNVYSHYHNIFRLLFIYTMCRSCASGSGDHSSTVRPILSRANVIELTQDSSIHPVLPAINLNSNTPMDTSTHKGLKPSDLLHSTLVFRPSAIL